MFELGIRPHHSLELSKKVPCYLIDPPPSVRLCVCLCVCESFGWRESNFFFPRNKVSKVTKSTVVVCTARSILCFFYHEIRFFRLHHRRCTNNTTDVGFGRLLTLFSSFLPEKPFPFYFQRKSIKRKKPHAEISERSLMNLNRPPMNQVLNFCRLWT